MANIKISELNELETRHRNDLLPIVDSVNNETKKIKVEDLINENVELIAVSPTAPSECSIGDKYFNTTSNKIYTAIATDTWSSTGENAKMGILYIVFETQESYAYDGNTLVSVGGGSGSSDIIIIGDESEATEDTKVVIDTTGTTDTLKYKDNNSFTELQIKALDSMPVGTIVEFNGQASDIPSGWEEVDNVLWENPDTTTAWSSTQTITLNSDDYDYLLIGYYPHITRDRIIRTVVVPKGYSFKIASSEGATFSERTFTRISDISFSIPASEYFETFGTNTPTNTSYNTIIPVFIMKM